jgi:hypothetical protein
MAKKKKAAGDGERARKKPTGAELLERAEQLLGQMMFAIGAGANGLHIKRSAVAKMRARYEPPTREFVQMDGWNEVWEANSIYTLRYFEAIGRLAAQHATLDGTPSIDKVHFERSRVFVEATYRQEIRTKPKTRMIGNICPIEPPAPLPE